MYLRRLQWNDNRIASGMLAPAVQIAAQPISDEGLLCMFPLVESKEPLVRQGVLALLAKRESQMHRGRAERLSVRTTNEPAQASAWADFQGSTHTLRQKYLAINDDLQPFRESYTHQENAWKAFHEWAMQWY